jgi:hypothetical protein
MGKTRTRTPTPIIYIDTKRVILATKRLGIHKKTRMDIHPGLLDLEDITVQ